MPEERQRSSAVNWGQYGLNENSREITPQSPENGDFGYGPGGHVPLDRNELFADELVSWYFIVWIAP